MLCSTLNGHALAQGGKTSEPVLVNGDSNEDLKARLDLLAQTAGEDNLIIMIGRLGSKESLPNLNWRRIRTVSSYLHAVRAVSKQRVILAAGEAIRGRGRIEVYLDGKLYMIIGFARNKSFPPEG